MFQTLIVGLCVVIVNGKNAFPKMDIQQDFLPPPPPRALVVLPIDDDSPDFNADF